MPFESMGQRGFSASSCFLEELCFSSEKEIGFWKPQSMHYCQDGLVQMPHSKSVVSSPLEKLFPAGALSVGCLELPPSHVARDHKLKYHIGREEGTVNFPGASGEFINSNQKPSSNLYLPAVSYSVETNKPDDKGTQCGDSISSSTSSDVFARKLGLSMNNVLFHKYADTVASYHEEEEPFGSMQEMEAQTIGNLLPDEDDLFSGVTGEFAKGGDDAEDFDLFSSVGGMELEAEDALCAGQTDFNFTWEDPNSWESSICSLAGKHTYGGHHSRTLFVRNISSDVEDSEIRTLFEQYGDIRSLYTACKHRGFVMISYFDIRAATNALRALQNKQLGLRKLEIHFSIPKDNGPENDINQGAIVVFSLNSAISNDDLHQLFGIYGQIKEIREIPRNCQHKVIEFYDVRAAEAACRALNTCNIAGKQIKLDLSSLGARRQCFMQRCSELEQDEAGLSKSSNDISSSESMSVSHGGRTLRLFDNRSVEGLHCANAPLTASTENVLSHGNSCVLNSLPSSLRVAPATTHFGLQKPCHSLDQAKFGNKCIPSSHPRSFPDCQDNFNISIPHNCSSTVANIGVKLGSNLSDRINGRHTSTVVSNGQPMELKGGVSGPSRNVTCPVHGHRWNNSNPFQLHPPSPMAWPTSPLFSSGVNAPFAQLPPFSGMPSEVLNSVSPPHYLHGGSAPSRSPSLRHAYTAGSPEDLAFCLGSLGSVGFPGSSPFHPLGRAPRVFSRAGGKCMEKCTNDAFSPHQMSHISPGKNTVTPSPTSFGYPHECGRNLSHRRNQGSSSYADKKQFELDTDRILHGEDSRTTLMIKNIPNKYTSKMLLTTIDEHCRGTYDFIYLPIDFKNKCNVGYAFINLIDPLQIIPFYKAFNGKKWEKFNSEKVAALAYARIQGKAALVTHFQNSSLMNEDKRCRPILFCTNGPNVGEQEPFPMGTNIRSKVGKARSNFTENYHHRGSPSTSINGEDSPDRSDSSGSY